VWTKVLLGSFFIIAMTLVSARGIVLSERIQNVLIAIQFGVLVIVSIIALVRVFAGTAGEQAISPSLAWLWPGGLDMSSIAQAIILCVFIYWGWDSCLAVGEETKNSDRTPGLAAIITTLRSRSITASRRTRVFGTSARRSSLPRETCSCAASSHCSGPSR
jgi:amino acid transporter